LNSTWKYALGGTILALSALSAATSEPGQPVSYVSVVRSLRFKQQTSSVAPVTIYIPPVAGVYRISAIYSVTFGGAGTCPPSSQCSWGLDDGFSYTDADTRLQGFTHIAGEGGSLPGPGSITVTGPPQLIHAAAKEPITYSTNFGVAPEAQPASYNAYIIVELLGDL